jgi:hypothetical protein
VTDVLPHSLLTVASLSPFQRSHYSPSGGVEPKLMRWDDAEIEPHHQHHLFESSLARPIHLDGELSALDITIKKEVIRFLKKNQK